MATTLSGSLLQPLRDHNLPQLAIWSSIQSDNHRLTREDFAESTKLSLTVLVALLSVQIISTDTPSPTLAFGLTFYTVVLRTYYGGLSSSELKNRITNMGPLMFIFICSIPNFGIMVLIVIGLMHSDRRPFITGLTVMCALLPVFAAHLRPLCVCIKQSFWRREETDLPVAMRTNGDETLEGVQS